jgi:hypothetical protein
MRSIPPKNLSWMKFDINANSTPKGRVEDLSVQMESFLKNIGISIAKGLRKNYKTISREYNYLLERAKELGYSEEGIEQFESRYRSLESCLR